MEHALKFVLITLQLHPQVIAPLTVLMVDQFHQLDACYLKSKDVLTIPSPQQLDVVNHRLTENSVKMEPLLIRTVNALILIQKDLLVIKKHVKMTLNPMLMVNVPVISTKRDSILRKSI
jgi:hypothetical protein